MLTNKNNFDRKINLDNKIIETVFNNFAYSAKYAMNIYFTFNQHNNKFIL